MDIPFEIQHEIIRKLPVRSLIRCRSVSKAWKSLIESSEFIAAYTVHHTDQQRLLVRYKDPVETNEKYVWFVDDDSFPQQKFSPTVPFLVKRLDGLRIIVGTSHGLLCLYGYYCDPGTSLSDRVGMTVLWNPSINKSVAVAVPNASDSLYDTNVLGFGVCASTSDPMIVKITHNMLFSEIESITSTFWRVEVFRLSSGVWRSLGGNLPRKSIEFTWSQVALDGFIYWFAFDLIEMDGEIDAKNMIVSFDMASEEFREVYLPDSLTFELSITLSIFKLKESLAILECAMIADKEAWVVWIMERGFPRSFTKLFTIMAPHASITLLGFRKSGKPIIEIEVEYDYEDDFGPGALVDYEPRSEHIKGLGISGTNHSFFVSSFTETLLLLDQSDRIIYFDPDSRQR